MSSSTGHSEMNRSYYTGNSLSVLHSSQHVYDDSVPTSVHSPPTSQRLFDNTPSCSALGPQLLHRNTGSPALAGPTRNVTGEAMPTSFDVALTQLSFLWSFLQRCGCLNCYYSPAVLNSPVSISLLQRLLCRRLAPCGRLPVRSSTQTSDQPGPSLIRVMWPFRRLSMQCPYLIHWMLLRRRPSPSIFFPSMSLRSWALAQLSSFSVDTWHVQISAHSVVQLDAATQLDLTEFLIGWIFSDSPIDRRHPFCQSPPSVLGAHVAPLPPPGLEQPAPLLQ